MWLLLALLATAAVAQNEVNEAEIDEFIWRNDLAKGRPLVAICNHHNCSLPALE